jgi:hypothetical protein
MSRRARRRGLTVAIESPSTVHEIPMRKLAAWLETGGKSPNEQAVKVRCGRYWGGVGRGASESPSPPAIVRIPIDFAPLSP